MASDLTTLAYPRHLHQGEASLIVQSVGEAVAAVREGWTVDYTRVDEDPRVDAPSVPNPDVPVAVDVAPAESLPVKRGRPKAQG